MLLERAGDSSTGDGYGLRCLRELDAATACVPSPPRTQPASPAQLVAPACLVAPRAVAEAEAKAAPLPGAPRRQAWLGLRLGSAPVRVHAAAVSRSSGLDNV